MKRLSIVQVLALIAAACFTFAAIGLIAVGPDNWWQPISLAFGAASMGYIGIRGHQTPKKPAHH